MTVLVVFIAVVALAVLLFWYQSQKVYGDMQAGRDAMTVAQQQAEQLNFEQALTAIDQAEEKFTIARQDMRGLQLLFNLPYIGPHLQAADLLLTSGIAASVAIRDLLTVGQDVVAVTSQTEGLTGALSGSLPNLSRLFKDLTAAQKHQMLAAFFDNVPKMREALVKADEAIAAFDQIPQSDLLQEFSRPLVPFRAKLVMMRGQIAAILPIAETVPLLLGYPNEKNYLFFFQNDTELRPTGGFLGVYGIATVRDADLVSLVTDDVYALDGPSESGARPAPPAPIQKYIGISKWYLRDANWSPDFSESARVMQQFFNEEYPIATGKRPPVIDGVLAIDTHFATDVLTLVGPVTIEGKTFNAANLVDELEFAVELGFAHQGIDSSERKDVVGKLGQAILDRLEAMPVAGLLATVGLVQRNLAEGHVLLSSNEPNLQSIVLRNDWGGKLAPVSGDYVSWIDANLAALKTDPTVKRTVSYSITPEAGSNDGSYLGTVKMTYRHTGHFDWKTTRLRTYARAYVPAGSQLIGVSGAMENDKIKDPARRPGKADTGIELDRAWFGAFISVEPGETKTLEFRYRLSPAVVARIRAGTYHLEVEKQPGTEAYGLTVDLDLGKNIKTAVPAEPSSEWGNTRYTFTSDLRTDRVFDVGL